MMLKLSAIYRSYLDSYCEYRFLINIYLLGIALGIFKNIDISKTNCLVQVPTCVCGITNVKNPNLLVELGREF